MSQLCNSDLSGDDVTVTGRYRGHPDHTPRDSDA